MYTIKWQERSKEVANLFNPAFCCTVLTASVVGYSLESNLGMPFPVPYLVFPLIMHKKTRDALPKTTKSSLPAWLDANPQVQYSFFDNLLAMKPFVGESVLFGSRVNWLVYKNGSLHTTIKNSQITKYAGKQGEVHDCLLRAKMAGKWLSISGTTDTLLELFGVRL